MCQPVKRNGRKPAPRPIQAPPACELDLLAYVPCPIKQTVREHFETLTTAHHRATGKTLNTHIPMGCRDDDPYEELCKVKSIDELPGITASTGFGDFMTADFFHRFVSRGHFASAHSGPIHPALAKAGLIDPERWYTPYAVWPHVLMVDLVRLGDRPVPRRWSDLLNPIYADHIICDGAHDTRFSPIPILHFYKEHGEDGMLQLAKNIRDTWHPAEMVKAAGSADKKGAAIYIAPWSFARARPASKNIRIVWPEEGAITSPIYAWVKAGAGEPVQILAQALIGEKLGRKAAQAGFPVLNPNVNNRVPSEASFCWLGWDFIRRHDIQKLIATTADIAERAWMAKAAQP